MSNLSTAARLALSRLEATQVPKICTASLATHDWWGVIAYAAVNGNYWKLFDLLQDLMTDREYASTVHEIWVATNGLEPLDARRRLIDHGRTITRAMWMSEKANRKYECLPDVVAIYRGTTPGRERNWSWTLTEADALHFATEPGNLVVHATVSKQDIIALFLDGNWEEDEVVVPGELVNIVSITPA